MTLAWGCLSTAAAAAAAGWYDKNDYNDGLWTCGLDCAQASCCLLGYPRCCCTLLCPCLTAFRIAGQGLPEEAFCPFCPIEDRIVKEAPPSASKCLLCAP